MFACKDCGRIFRRRTSAERASREGCPQCGGLDIGPSIDVRLSMAEMMNDPDAFGILHTGDLCHATSRGTVTTY
jgi:hypothetical protein